MTFGKFVRDWMLECKVNNPTLRHLVEFQRTQIEVVGKIKRHDAMDTKNKLVDTLKTKCYIFFKLKILKYIN